MAKAKKVQEEEMTAPVLDDIDDGFGDGATPFAEADKPQSLGQMPEHTESQIQPTTPDVVPGEADAAPTAQTPQPAREEAAPVPSGQESNAVADEEWPADLLASAGMTQEQAVATFGDPEVMDRALRFHDAQVAQLARQRHLAAMQQQLSQQQAQRPAPPQIPQPLPPQQTPVPPPDQHFQWYEPFKVPTRPDGTPEYDDDAVALVNMQNEHIAKQFARLAQTLGTPAVQARSIAEQLAAQQMQAAQEQYVSELERRFESLGDDWHDVFGKGSGREMAAANPQSPQLANRIRLDTEMEMIRQGRAVQGLPPLSFDQTFSRAIRMVYGQKIDTLNQQQLSEKAKSRRGLQAMRPTARKTPQASQDERTLAAVDKVLRNKGRQLDYGDEEEFPNEI